MKSKRSAAEVILLAAIPAVFLIGSTLSLFLTDALGAVSYLPGCVAAMLALAACLIWGASLAERMVRSAARAGMTAVMALLAVWVILFALRQLGNLSDTAASWLRLAAAVPPALLPAVLRLTFLGAVRPEDEQKPDALFWALLAAGVLGVAGAAACHFLALPLTLTVLWGILCYAVAGMTAAVILLFLRRMTPRAIPAAVLWGIGLAAQLLMLLEVSPLSWEQLPYAVPLFCFGFCELAVAGGLIPDGRSWPALLGRSTFPLQLMDQDGNMVYGPDQAVSLAPNHKNAILNNRYHVSQILDRDFQLSATVIRGGYALHQKDLRDLRALQDTLQRVTEELEKTNEVLSRESEIEAELQRVTKKNAFFAEQELKIREKTDRASLLLRCAAAASPEPGFRRSVVTRANLLVTYTQQLGELLKVARENEYLPVFHLREALEASAKAATAAGARCRVYHVAQGFFPSDVILSLYDLFEMVLEDIFCGELSTLEIRLRNEQEGLRLILTVKDTMLEALSTRVDHIIARTSELGGEARFNVEGGDVSIFIEFLKGGAGCA